MKWTKEKPTKEGWYWFRHQIVLPEGCEIVKVYDRFFITGKGKKCVLGSHMGFVLEDLYCDEDIPYAEWAGPIPEPEE